MSNTLFDAIVAARGNCQGPLFVDKDKVVLSDQAFFDLSARMSSVLMNAGAHTGERVAVQVNKSIEALALYVACLRAGAVFLPLNTAYTQSELKYFIDDATPALLVLDPEREAMGAELLDAAKVLTLSDSNTGTLIEAVGKADIMEEVVPRAADDLAAILYTSGTTGRSKGRHADACKSVVEFRNPRRLLAVHRRRCIAACLAYFSHAWIIRCQQCDAA